MKGRLRLKNIWIYLLSFSASGFGIALNFFLARVLEADLFGKLQYLIALCTTCSQLLIFGINSFLIREAKNEKRSKSLVSDCYSLFFAIVLFTTPIMFYFLYNYVAYTSFNLVLTILAIIVSFLMGISSLISAYYQGSDKYHISVILENLIPKFLLFVLSVLFFVVGKIFDFQKNYLLIYLIIYLVLSLPLFIKTFRGFSFKLKAKDYKSICFFFGVTATYSLGNNLTKVLQGGLYKNTVALGVISISLSIVSLVTIFTNVLSNIIKPIYAKKSRDKDIEGLLNDYRFNTRVNSYICIPLYLFFILHCKNFLYIFGESYVVFPSILIIIAITNMINDLTGPNGTMLSMIGKEKWELFNGLLYFAVYFACVFIFSTDEITGLCYALLIGQIAVNVAKFAEISVIFKKFPLNLKTIFTELIVIGIDFGVIFVLHFITSFTLWLAVGIVTGIALVFVNCFVLSLYRKSDFKTLLSLKL